MISLIFFKFQVDKNTSPNPENYCNNSINHYPSLILILIPIVRFNKSLRNQMKLFQTNHSK